MRTSIIAIVLVLVGCKKGPEKIEAPEGEGAEGASKEVPCGQNVCRDGKICCNPSCGLCAPPDGMCTQQFCDAPRDDEGVQEQLPDAPTSCDKMRCASGTHCEMVQVQCAKAPCAQNPECRQDEPRSNEQR